MKYTGSRMIGNGYLVGTLILLGLLLMAAVPAGAGAEAVFDTRNGENTIITWEANSTHYVDGKFKVLEGETLIIEPGVTIKFSYAGAMEGNPHTFRVYGKLIARGTPDNPILFTSNATNPAPYDWDKVKFHKQADPDSIMEHCIIEYSTQGVQPDRCDVTLKNCTMRHIGKYGVKVVKSSPHISGCYISTRNIGIRIKGDTSHQPNPTILNNVFDNCDYFGILACSRSESVIKGNVFRNSGEYGIYTTNTELQIEDNEFTGNRIGIALINSMDEITDNEFEDSKEYGIYTSYGNELTIEDNVFEDNVIGVSAHNAQGKIENNEFKGTKQATSIEMVDCDIVQNDNIHNGIISSDKHIVLQAVNSDGYPIKGTSMTITDALGTEVTTKDLGGSSTYLVGLPYMEIDPSGKTKSFVPYKVTVKKDGITTVNEVSQFTNDLVQVKIEKSFVPKVTMAAQEKTDGTVTFRGKVDFGDLDTEKMDYRVLVQVKDGEWKEATGKSRWAYQCESSDVEEGSAVHVKLSDGIGDPSIKKTIDVEQIDTDFIIVIMLGIGILIMLIVLLLIHVKQGKKKEQVPKEEE